MQTVSKIMSMILIGTILSTGSISACAGDNSNPIPSNSEITDNNNTTLSKEKTIISTYEDKVGTYNYLNEIVPESIYYEECIDGVLWKGTLYIIYVLR